MKRNNGSFHMVLRSHFKKQRKIIASLPEEIIFHILVLIPPRILYAVMRFVCRHWNRIINDPFFVTMLRPPTSTFLVHDRECHAHFLHITECDKHIENINFQLPGDVLSTCNGLTLVKDITTHRLCYIVNLATKRMMTLPTMPLNEYQCCLAFAASSNTYKVVVITQDRSNRHLYKHQCAILTVNVDRTWRLINCAHIDEFMSISEDTPIVSAGFVYWLSLQSSYLVSLNIESESIKTILLPQPCRERPGQISLRPKGNTISCIREFEDGYSIRVWVLKDDESEDWVEFPDLRVEEMRREMTNVVPRHLRNRMLFSIYPLSWLKNEESILFTVIGIANSLIVYDVKTGRAFSFILDIDTDIICLASNQGRNGLLNAIVPHSSSLAWVSP